MLTCKFRILYNQGHFYIILCLHVSVIPIILIPITRPHESYRLTANKFLKQLPNLLLLKNYIYNDFQTSTKTLRVCDFARQMPVAHPLLQKFRNANRFRFNPYSPVHSDRL